MSTATGLSVALAVLVLAGASARADVERPETASDAPISTAPYKCYNALDAVASGDELNSGRYAAAHLGNYLWILDGGRYAEASDSGVDHRVGDKIVPDDGPAHGPWARARTVMHSVLQGFQGPTLRIAFKGSDHPHLTCTR